MTIQFRATAVAFPPSDGVYMNIHVPNTPFPRTGEPWATDVPLIESELAANQNNCDVLFLGDSITRNLRTTGAAQLASYYGSRKPLIQGISGDSTQNLLYRETALRHMVGITPKLAIILIGTNNWSANSTYMIRDGILACAAQVRRQHPTTKVLVNKIFPRGTAGSPERTIVANVNTFLAASSFFDGTTTVLHDIGTAFYLPATSNIDTSLMPDLLHPSAAGYVVWFNAIESTVVTMLA